jgi:hypothetical protein
MFSRLDALSRWLDRAWMDAATLLATCRFGCCL